MSKKDGGALVVAPRQQGEEKDIGMVVGGEASEREKTGKIEGS